MGWIIGKGIGIPFRMGGSGLGSSYWLTRKPTALVLITISDTIIFGTFTINGTGQDGHKVYISTDNVTFTLLETLAGDDHTFRSTALTTATVYYFKVVAYKGSNESDAIEDNVATFNNALIGGMRFAEEVDYAFSNTLQDAGYSYINHSPAQYFNGKTYIAFAGADDDPYILTYTHATNTWSAEVKIGTNPLANTDNHGSPAILIDAAGYIHCIFGAHNSVPLYSKSTNAEDITSWTEMTSPITAPDELTYAQLIQFSTGLIYLFYRIEGGSSSYWGYKTSNDGGANWSAYTEVSRDIAYWYFRKGVGDTIHAVGFGNNQTSATRKNIYYIFYNGTNWVNIDGDIQPAPIVLAGNNCLAYNSGDYYTPSANITHDSTNKPIIIFPKSVAELDLTEFDTYILKHNGAAWEDFNIGARSGFNQSYNPVLDVISDTIYHAYLTEGQTQPYSGIVERWISRDAGETWKQEKVVYVGNAYGSSIVKNYNSNAKYIFSTYQGSETVYNNSGFLWGEGGFVGGTTSLLVPSIKGGLSGVKNVGLLLVSDETGSYYNFNGDDSITLADNDSLSFDTGSPDAPFSITLNINITNTVTNQAIFVKNDATGAREYQLTVYDNKFNVSLMQSSVANLITCECPYDKAGEKHFIVITYDGSGSQNGLKIYIDNVEGVLTQTMTGTYVGMANSTAKLIIGSYRNASNFLTAKFYDLKFWNKVLTPTEMGYVKDNIEGW